MTNKSSNNIFTLHRKSKLSTLELWQQQLQALKRISQNNKAMNQARVSATETNASEMSFQQNV